MRSLLDMLNESIFDKKYDDFIGFYKYPSGNYEDPEPMTVKNILSRYGKAEFENQPLVDVKYGASGDYEGKIFILADGKDKLIDKLNELDKQYHKCEVYFQGPQSEYYNKGTVKEDHPKDHFFSLVKLPSKISRNGKNRSPQFTLLRKRRIDGDEIYKCKYV